MPTNLKGNSVVRLSEAQIERTCTDILELDRWRALKTDPVSRKEWGKGFGEPGMADDQFIRYDREMPCRGQAEVLWVEFKTRHGKVAKRQLAWHQAERARGALTAIAGIDFEATIVGFQAWYLASGLNRRLHP